LYGKGLELRKIPFSIVKLKESKNSTDPDDIVKLHLYSWPYSKSDKDFKKENCKGEITERDREEATPLIVKVKSKSKGRRSEVTIKDKSEVNKTPAEALEGTKLLSVIAISYCQK
jgi:hypothetical protein